VSRLSKLTGMTLTEYRKANGLTLEAVALAVDVTKGRIHQIEAGANCSPELALRIEAFCGGRVNASMLSPTIADARQPRAA